MEPDYSTYDLSALLEARDGIDRQAQSLRYFKISQEIDDRLVRPEAVDQLVKRDNYAKVIFLKVIIGFLSLFLANKLFVAFTDGYISWKGKRNYFVHDSPQTYYFLVALHIFFLGFCLYLVTTGRWANKRNKR